MIWGLVVRSNFPAYPQCVQCFSTPFAVSVFARGWDDEHANFLRGGRVVHPIFPEKIIKHGREPAVFETSMNNDYKTSEIDIKNSFDAFYPHSMGPLMYKN